MRSSITVLGMITMITMQIFNFSNSSAQKDQRLVLTGTVIAHSGEGVPMALLIADDGTSMPIDIGRNGRFWVNVPVGLKYQIAFARKGCVTKIVQLDLVASGQRIRARIGFDVELFAGQELTSLVAGKIGFASSNGRLLVEHHPNPALQFEPQFIQVNNVLP